MQMAVALARSIPVIVALGTTLLRNLSRDTALRVMTYPLRKCHKKDTRKNTRQKLDLVMKLMIIARGIALGDALPLSLISLLVKQPFLADARPLAL